MTTLYAGGMIFDGIEMLEEHGVLVGDGRIHRAAPLSEFDEFARQQHK